MEGYIVSEFFFSEFLSDKTPSIKSNTVNFCLNTCSYISKIEWEEFKFDSKKRIFPENPEKLDYAFMFFGDYYLKLEDVYFKQWTAKQDTKKDLIHSYTIGFSRCIFYFSFEDFILYNGEKFNNIKKTIVNKRFNQ